MMVTAFGTIRVSRYIQKIVSRPGKLSRAKAYAPRMLKNTWPRVRTPVTRAVFPRYRMNPAAKWSWVKLEKEGEAGGNPRGLCEDLADGLERRENRENVRNEEDKGDGGQEDIEAAELENPEKREGCPPGPGFRGYLLARPHRDCLRGHAEYS